MYRRTLLATLVALLAMPAAALAAGGTRVIVRVEGVRRTLLLPTVVHTHRGWITRYGAPRGDCSARSAQGALNVATHRRWRGIWSTEFGPEYEITSVLGETHNFNRETKYYWEIFADNVSASAGACELKLHRGEQLVFAAVPQTGNAYATALSASHTARVGQPLTVKVVWFNAKGKPAPLAGARITGGGLSATTDAHGTATLVPTHTGTLVLHSHHEWSASAAYVRAAPVRVHVS